MVWILPMKPLQNYGHFKVLVKNLFLGKVLSTTLIFFACMPVVLDTVTVFKLLFFLYVSLLHEAQRNNPDF